MTLPPELGFFDAGTDLSASSLYDGVVAPYGAATRLPPVAYRSKAFSDLEDEKLWTRAWVCVGNLSRAPRAGDLLPFTTGKHGIHVRRQHDGSLRAFFNFAQHGGCRFVPRQCQTGQKTSCFYTSCGHSRDGDVLHARPDGSEPPEMYMYVGINPLKLVGVHVRSAGPLAFVHLDVARLPDGDDRDAHVLDALGGVLEEACDAGGHAALDVGANWKLVGPRLLAELRDELLPGIDTSAVPVRSLVDEDACWGVATSSPAGRIATGFDALGEIRGASARAVLWCYPNLLVAVDGPGVATVVMQPTGMAQTRLRVDFYTRTPGGDPQRDWALRIGRCLDATIRCASALQIEHAGSDNPSPFLPQPTRFAAAAAERDPFAWQFHQRLVRDLVARHTYAARPLYSTPGRALNAGVNAGPY